MIIGKISPGSGIGDMLFGIIATRVRAADLGVPYGFIGKEHWRGKGWMDIDFGEDTSAYKYHIEEYSGKLILDEWPGGIKEYVGNKPYFDPEFEFIKDNTVIDGYGCQDIRYFEHRLGEVREWLKVGPLATIDVINIRGGEYRGVPELILPLEDYWYKAIGVLNKHQEQEFAIHTDDPDYVKQMFGDTFEIYKDVAFNWRCLRYAKRAIISNSAFAIIPRLLKHLEDPEAVTIAPHFWAGRNVGEWRRPGNYYKQFLYI